MCLDVCVGRTAVARERENRVPIITLKVIEVSASAARHGAHMVELYREANRGSGRAMWGRMSSLAGAVEQASTNAPWTGVEVSHLFPGYNYHAVHRALKAEVFADYWHYVQVVGLVDVVEKYTTRSQRIVTGTGSTTRKDARLFLVPATPL